MSWLMIALSAAWLGCLPDNSGAAELYYTNRTFEPKIFNIQINATIFRLYTESGYLTGIVKGTNITINTNATYGIERQVINLGYASATDAWNAAVSYNGLEFNPTGISEQAGWVCGTTSTVPGEWGAYYYRLQNHIVFKSSTTTWYQTSTTNIPVAISNIYVGSMMSNYPPMAENLEDTGPVISTNFPGANTGEDRSFHLDYTNVYYQLVISPVRVSPRVMARPVGGSNVIYEVRGTNMPDGATWSITTNGTEGEAVLTGTTTSAVVTPGTVASNYTIRASSIANTSYYDEVTLWVVGVDKLMYNRYGQADWSNMPAPPEMVVIGTGQYFKVKAIKVPTNAYWPSGKPAWTGAPNPNICGDWISFTPTTTGIYTIAAECGNAKTGLVAAVQIDFLNASMNETNALKVGKWENGFDAGPAVKDNFIDLDPDRFYVRVNDQSKKDSGKVSVKLSTDSAGTVYDDNATEIELTEDPANSGIFISTNMLLVSDDVDDDFTNVNVVADDAKNDRTHKIALGGKVKVQYPETGTVICEKEASVPPSLKTVDVNIIILRDKPQAIGGVPVIAVAAVSNFWKIAKERYSQIGVNIQWTGPTVEDPPAGVDLSDWLQTLDSSTSTVVSIEAKTLISALGTTNTTDDIHVFYVNRILVGSSFAGGLALADFHFEESDDPFTYNVFIENDTSSPWGGYAAAHELSHLTTDAGHPTTNTWRLMHGEYLTTTGATGSRRLTAFEETTIRGNSHVH